MQWDHAILYHIQQNISCHRPAVCPTVHLSAKTKSGSGVSSTQEKKILVMYASPRKRARRRQPGTTHSRISNDPAIQTFEVWVKRRDMNVHRQLVFNEQMLSMARKRNPLMKHSPALACGTHKCQLHNGVRSPECSPPPCQMQSSVMPVPLLCRGAVCWVAAAAGGVHPRLGTLVREDLNNGPSSLYQHAGLLPFPLSGMPRRTAGLAQGPGVRQQRPNLFWPGTHGGSQTFSHRGGKRAYSPQSVSGAPGQGVQWARTLTSSCDIQPMKFSRKRRAHSAHSKNIISRFFEFIRVRLTYVWVTC